MMLRLHRQILIQTDPWYEGSDVATSVVGIPFTHGINRLFSERLKFGGGSEIPTLQL